MKSIDVGGGANIVNKLPLAYRGSNLEGCGAPCNRMEFGCCPDKLTPARGPEYQVIKPMVIISDGNSGIDTHIRINLCYVIC